MGLMVLNIPAGRPVTMKQAAETLHIDEAAIDHTYGIVPLDPAQGKYAVRVTTERVSETSEPVYADPVIEPF